MTSTRAPVIFFGHGNPMYAIEQNRFTDAWSALRPVLADLNGLVMVSAHWYGNGSLVTAMPRPKTIHDFGGFPEELFAVEYPAPGAPELAARIASLATPEVIELDQSWGLDHGTWSVLRHALPDASVPIVQVSIDATMTPDEHIELGRRLGELRDEGFAIAGSGNVVHNLGAMQFRPGAVAYDWAQNFERSVRSAIEQRDLSALAAPDSLGEGARLSIPTPEHYLPLLPVMGALRNDDAVDIIVDGIDAAAISMLSFVAN